MQILRWQVGNSLKNYQYILYDAQNAAALIDPLDNEEILRLVQQLHLNVRAIFITHEHDDHAREAHALQLRFKAPVYTSEKNMPLITARATAVADRGVVVISPELSLTLHETPGHARGHAAYESNGFFFSGDCLFHGGCGHCRLPGADIETHYHTFSERLTRLAPDLILMPGHYYAAKNLDFCLHVEPTNARAGDLRRKIKNDADEMEHTTTLRDEKGYNPFMRLDSKSLRVNLSKRTGKALGDVSDLQVFTELRKLRDSF